MKNADTLLLNSMVNHRWVTTHLKLTKTMFLGIFCMMLVMMSNNDRQNSNKKFLTMALSSSSSTSESSPSLRSPWASAEWKLSLNIGREKDTTFNEEWGASGARLIISSLDVEVTSDKSTENDNFLGRGANIIRPIQDTCTFVTKEGEQTVKVKEGGWKIRLPQGKFRSQGYASMLRFYLDFVTPIKRNDIVIPGNSRVYFVANCWRPKELEQGRKSIRPLWNAFQKAQQVVENQVAHESGDRRLDGNDIIETLAGYKDMAKLVLDRDEKKRTYREAGQYLPPVTNIMEGFWPGDSEPLSIAPIEMFLEEKKFFGQEYHLLGKFKARPLSSTTLQNESVDDDEDELEEDDDYEYYDDDEEDDEDDNEKKTN